jgi:hypothetical protein
MLHAGGTVHGAGCPADLSHIAVFRVICQAEVIAAAGLDCQAAADSALLIDLASQVASPT